MFIFICLNWIFLLFFILKVIRTGIILIHVLIYIYWTKQEIQDNIKKGNYGAKPIQKIPILDQFLLHGKCYLGNCTMDPDYDSRIGKSI